MNKLWILATLILFGVVSAIACAPQEQARKLPQTKPQAQKQAQEVPDGFQQLLPRGGIPAIDNPQYVAADKAKILDGAYVFGVVIEGQPVAYSLNLLNSHEVVNDTIGKTNFAAVW